VGIIVKNMDELLKKLIIDFGNYDITFVTYIKWKMWIQKMWVMPKKRPPSNEEFLKMHQETFQYKKF
jgi:hypothetical protein